MMRRTPCYREVDIPPGIEIYAYGSPIYIGGNRELDKLILLDGNFAAPIRVNVALG